MARIFFDFDGVLVRSRRGNRTFLWSEQLENDLGIPLGIQKQIFDPIYWHPTITGKSAIEPRLRALFATHALSATADQFISYWLERDLNWRNEVIELAKDLAGQKNELFIATNQDHVRGRFIKEQAIVTSIFSDVYYSARLGVAKPDVAFFLSIEKCFSASPAEAMILIDDDQKNIESASRAGWQAIRFDPDLDPGSSIDALRTELLALIS